MMKLSQILSLYSELRWGDDPVREIKQICVDSRKVDEASVFVAIRGHEKDGHDYLNDAVNQGAAAVVVETDYQIPESYKGAVVVVEDTRDAIDELAARFYGHPAEELFCVGVTGTNGKTSVVYMVESILDHFGWKTGVMGTIDHHLGSHKWNSSLTTPNPLVIQKRLQEFSALGAQASVFEVSSHALVQKRADQIPFDTVVFTNLSRDHLDYHSDMDTYFAAKQRLFLDVLWKSSKKNLTAIINKDDPYARKLQVADSARKWFYSGEGPADLEFSILKQEFSGSLVSLKTPRGTSEMLIPLLGRHNIYNAVAAVGVGLSAGISLDTCVGAINKFSGVPGRLERVVNDWDRHVFVDYAHTDDALRTVLTELSRVRKNTDPSIEIITLFGCGGDRDKGKRPLMAAAALKGSDKVIITSDNPRTEDPEAIIKDILKAVPQDLLGKSVWVEPDRKSAIVSALSLSKPGDVVLIAGKGHEDYQIVGTEKIEFGDGKVVREFVSEL